MKLLIVLSLIFCVQIAKAQYEESFSEFSASYYQELDKNPKNTIALPEDENKIEEQEAVINVSEDDKKTTEETNLFEQKNPSSTSENVSSSSDQDKAAAEEEEEENDQQRKIYLTLTNIDAIIAPTPSASFCSAVLVVGNNLKKDIKSFSGTLTIGKMTKKFNFRNIPKENIVAQKYIFSGASCEQISNEPQFDFQSCKIDGWTDKKCKQKIQFIPVLKAPEMAIE